MQIHDEPTLGWTVVLRRQPVHLREGRPEGGYTDDYELVCCDCGDDPDLDFRDVSPRLQRIRGPYGVSGRHRGIRAARQASPWAAVSCQGHPTMGDAGDVKCGEHWSVAAAITAFAPTGQ
jgi:hypothetical protein